jgi:hypothetical protein
MVKQSKKKILLGSSFFSHYRFNAQKVSTSSVVPRSVLSFLSPCYWLIDGKRYTNYRMKEYAVVGRDSSVGIATRYELNSPGIESRWGARFSASVQIGSGAYPASCTMGTGSFPGVKRPGLGVDHPPPSSAEVKERVELHLYSPSGPSWPVLGWPLPLPMFLITGPKTTKAVQVIGHSTV